MCEAGVAIGKPLPTLEQIQEKEMIGRALLLLAMAGIYVAIRLSRQTEVRQVKDHAAEAQWANEGGANAHVSV